MSLKLRKKREEEERRAEAHAEAVRFYHEELAWDAFKAAHAVKRVGIPIEPDAPDCAGFWNDVEVE